MRILLGMLILACSAGFLAAADDPVARDEEILKTAQLKSDGEALLHFFRDRTMSEGDLGKVRDLIQKLDSDSYREREMASRELIAKGPAVVEALRAMMENPPDLEMLRRAELCLHKILAKDHRVDVPAAAARLLAVRKPTGAVETLLAFMPFANNEPVADEVRDALIKLGVQDGKLEPALQAALADKNPIRRATAGEVVVRSSAAAADKTAARNLIKDKNPLVRWRVATALANAKEKEAVSVLIDLLPKLTLGQAWQVEDMLYRLGEDRNPPAVSLGGDENSRTKCRDAWAAWWKEHGAKIDMARLSERPALLGNTLVVLLDLGQILELGPNRQERWKIDNLNFPLDVQYLPAKSFGGNEDRVLVAEYHAHRVTERDLKGTIVWQKRIGGPLAAQRLPNGNTFVVTNSQIMEFDKDEKEVLNTTLPNGEVIMKASKLPNGEIVCLAHESRVFRLDAKGKLIKSFDVTLSMKLSGGRLYALPNGRILVPHNAENKVSEYDADGKEIWSIPVDQPVAAVRLPNGNTLVTSMSPARGAVEFDRHGTEVWTYRTDTRVTRALRR
jgi:HEAT repeat protein